MSTARKPEKVPPPSHPATLVSSRHLLPEKSDSRDEVRELVIEVKEKDFTCAAGQSIGVLAPVHKGSREAFHLRWYSVADIAAKSKAGHPCFTICVRRRVYKDPDTGLIYRGLASNYLCDLKPGAPLNITGPHGIPFDIPSIPDPTMILIGIGTGIAPFRAFVKHLHKSKPNWKGLIRLFYGTRNGLDILYTNDPHEDVMQYFDQETFEAFKALCPPPNWADPIAWDMAYSERGEELLKMLESPKTFVYVAGLEPIREHLDQLFATLTGSVEAWDQRKADLVASKRWVELLY